MYRDDEAGQQARRTQLRKELAALAERKHDLVHEGERFAGAVRRVGLRSLLRWWCIALILLSAALGITVGSALHTRHEIVVKRCMETR